MSEPKKDEPCLHLVIALTLIVPAMLFRAWTIVKGLEWFVAPLYPQAVEVTLLAALGLATLAQCVLPNNQSKRASDTALGVVGRSLGCTAAALVLMYAIKSAQATWPAF